MNAGEALASRPPGRVAPDVQSVSIPLRWYIDPLRATLQKLIRPATARTRRKELVIKSRLSVEDFDRFLAPLNGYGMNGLVCAPPHSFHGEREHECESHRLCTHEQRML